MEKHSAFQSLMVKRRKGRCYLEERSQGLLRQQRAIEKGDIENIKGEASARWMRSWRRKALVLARKRGLQSARAERVKEISIHE